MRHILIGASILALTTSTLSAAPKNKRAPKKTTNLSSTPGADAPIEPSAIEIDSGTNALPGSGGPSASLSPPPVSPSTGQPIAINDRPLTLKKERFDVHGALPIAVVSLPSLTGDKTSSTSIGLAFGASYGIDDKLEIGGDYAISFHPGDVKGPLTLRGSYQLIAKPKYDLAVGGAFVVHPIGFRDPVSGADSTITYVAIQGGAWFRYRVTRTWTAFTGLPALPHPAISLSRSGLAFPPMPYQLTLGINNSGAVGLSLPVGVGYQVTPNIYAFAATNLANIKIARTPNALLFKDFIPLTVGGFYSLRQLDIGAVFSDDLHQPADYLTFSIVARYFIR